VHQCSAMVMLSYFIVFLSSRETAEP